MMLTNPVNCLFQALVDAVVVWRQIKVFLNPFIEFREISIIARRLRIELAFDGNEHWLPPMTVHS